VEGMPARILEKRELDSWVKRLLERGEVIAPVRGPAGDEVFASVASPGEILWSFENPLLPPKSFLLPQVETLARIRKENGHHRVEPAREERPRVLFNVRNCDVAGLAFLEEMHRRDLPDEAVLRRAGELTLVSLACTTPCPPGFCVCCDAGPFLKDRFDLQLTDLGDVLWVDVGSEKGQILLDLAPGLFREPTVAESDSRREAEHEALARFGEETCHFGSAMRRISTRRVAEGLWEAMAPWCLECGGCNFACPTCYCFSISDRDDGNGGWIRSRLWDSCQFPAFTMEAAGHNPRGAQEERMKRRFHHKVSAQYFKRDGQVGCVGCGRCIKVCMGTTDMPSVVEAIREGAWTGGREA
jgi:sulfhydrogenase subunit beta (sulfur reductase)